MFNLIHLPLGDTLIVSAFCQLAVFVAFLVLNRKGDWKLDVILAFVLLFMAVPVISTFVLAQNTLLRFFPLAHVGNGSVFIVGPLLFLYLRKYILGRFLFPLKDRPHIVLFPFAVALFISLALLQNRNYSYRTAGSVSALCLFAYTAFYFALSLGLIAKNRARLSADALSVFWPVFLFSGYLLLLLGRFVIFITWDVFGMADLCPYTYNLYFMTFIFFINALFLLALRSARLFRRPRKYGRSTLTEEEKGRYETAIREKMDGDKPFLDPLLNLESLAASLGLASKELSQLVNERFSMNFTEFVNSYRVKEVIRLMGGAGRTRTILDLCLEAGFNSKSTFNQAFKKHAGVPPREYKKRSETMVSDDAARVPPYHAVQQEEHP